jgi:flagellar basal body-associated protein FliL
MKRKNSSIPIIGLLLIVLLIAVLYSIWYFHSNMTTVTVEVEKEQDNKQKSCSNCAVSVNMDTLL